MRILIFFILIFANLYAVQTPKKLENFIYKNIGKEQFLSDQNRFVVTKYKDWGYLDFDLYRSIQMSIDLPIVNGKSKRDLLLDGVVYKLEIINRSDEKYYKDHNQTKIDFIFTKVR